MYNEPKGAFTGETSPDMLVAAGIEWTLLGHSERRHVFGETDEMMTKKMEAAMARPLKVVACIGEQQAAREGGTTNEVCAAQMAAFAAGVANTADWDRVVIAYEPVWAIGTGLAATPEMAQETHAAIRSWVSDNVSPEVRSPQPLLCTAKRNRVCVTHAHACNTHRSPLLCGSSTVVPSAPRTPLTSLLSRMWTVSSSVCRDPLVCIICVGGALICGWETVRCWQVGLP